MRCQRSTILWLYNTGTLLLAAFAPVAAPPQKGVPASPALLVPTFRSLGLPDHVTFLLQLY